MSWRVVLMSSVRGTTAGRLLRAVFEPDGALHGCQIEVVGLVVPREDAPISVVAHRYQVRVWVGTDLPPQWSPESVDAVWLLGWSRLLPAEWVQRWYQQAWNTHPSLLPAFAGLFHRKVHEAVLERGVKWTGVTLHAIDEGADTGPILTQELVPVAHDDTVDSLTAKVQEAEFQAIVRVWRAASENRIVWDGPRRCRVVEAV